MQRNSVITANLTNLTRTISLGCIETRDGNAVPPL